MRNHFHRFVFCAGTIILLLAGCNAPTSESPSAPTRSPSTGISPAADTPIASPAEHRIGIRVVNGAAEFYDRLTGEKFVQRGAGLWRWKHWPPGQDSVIDLIFNTQIGQLDSALAELPKMHADGFNTVRLWFSACWGGAPGCLDRAQGGLDPAYLQNMARFIQVAKENGIYVILTMDSLPDLGGYQAFLNPYRGRFEGYNLEFMTQGGIDAQAKFQTDLIRGLMEVGAPMDYILAYQLKEEAFFEEQLPPLSATSGQVTPANGQTYDLADPAQRRALMEDSWLYYIEQVSQRIKAIDATALVTMGFFVQQEPNPVLVGDPRRVYMHKVLYESALDFVSLSAYPGFDITLQQQAENFDIIGYNQKPLVIGEFGAERNNYPDVQTAAVVLQAWQVESCKFGVDGWQVWTWDGGGEVHDGFWEAVEGGGAIRRALSPALNPDPCAPGEEMNNYPNLAYGKPVKTSAVYGELFLGGQAVDLSQTTQWNAGNGPPQWIEIDLQKPSVIDTIRLFAAQDPEGLTVHRVLGRGESGAYQLLHEFRGVTREGEVLEFASPQPWGDIRFVRIETTTSPSWVGWHEIQVLGAPQTSITPVAAPFTGTWQGPDPDDGSSMTITLAQTGNDLTGTFKDTFSGNKPPPGYEGTGSGKVLSPTTAQMTFHLSRHDGATVDLQLTFTLSDQNNTLTITSDLAANPWVMKRQGQYP